MLVRMLRRGRGPSFLRLLTVTGRRTGIARSTPVAPLVTDRGRWLVAAYGEVGWVRNTRAAGRVTLGRGATEEVLTASEVDPADAVPVLRAYRAMKPAGWIVRSHLGFGRRSSDAEIAAAAPYHPVFELTPGDRQDSGPSGP
jgi:deazaflavin-dependent oxidoreductase (nitroreductase family)